MRFGSIQVTQSGKYRGRYRVKGKDYYTRHVSTRSQAEAELRLVRRQMKDGSWEPPAKRRGRKTPATATMILEEWATLWLEQCTQEGMSPNTIRSYESIFRARISPVLGDVAVEDVTTSDIKDLSDRLTAGYSRTTVRNTMLTLSACLSAAVDAGLIEANPVRSVKGVYRKSARAHEPVALTARQLTAVIEGADSQFRAAFALAGWGALRYGEIAALRRRDVNVRAGTVSVSRSVARASGGELVEKAPKSAAGVRTIALPKEAMRIVKEHLDMFTPPGRDALVFYRPHGAGGYLTDRVLRRHLHEVCDELELPRMRLHDLRHTGLTLYGQAGATLADLMARAGHADAKTVMIYQHSSVQRDRELVGRMDG